MVVGKLRRARRAVVLLVVLSVLGLGGWQLRHLRSGDAGPDGNAGTGLTLYQRSADVALPAIEGRTIGGQTLNLADWRGHVVVLNVWGSWCAPCRAEAPDLARISAATANRGVRFVGVDVRDNPAAARAFERTYGITYPSFDDQNGLVLAQFTGIIPVSAVPSTLVVDRRGAVRARVVGRVQGSVLRGLIQDAEKQR